MRDDDELSELERCSDHLIAEGGHVEYWYVCPTFLTRPCVRSRLSTPDILAAVEFGQMSPERLVLQAADVKLGAN